MSDISLFYTSLSLSLGASSVIVPGQASLFLILALTIAEVLRDGHPSFAVPCVGTGAAATVHEKTADNRRSPPF